MVGDSVLLFGFLIHGFALLFALVFGICCLSCFFVSLGVWLAWLAKDEGGHSLEW